MRDIFNYFIPAIPFIILTSPILENMGILKIGETWNKVPYLHETIISQVTVIVIIYVIGRIVNVLSYLILPVYDLTIGNKIFPWMKDYFTAYDKVSKADDNMVTAKAIQLGMDFHYHLLERNNLIAMGERSFSASGLIIAILLVFDPIISKNPLFSCGMNLFYIFLSLCFSVIYYFMLVGTATELHKAANTIIEYTPKEQNAASH
jgi:hypothetical protein